jgi:hypothetical protein
MNHNTRKGRDNTLKGRKATLLRHSHLRHIYRSRRNLHRVLNLSGGSADQGGENFRVFSVTHSLICLGRIPEKKNADFVKEMIRKIKTATLNQWFLVRNVVEVVSHMTSSSIYL